MLFAKFQGSGGAGWPRARVAHKSTQIHHRDTQRKWSSQAWFEWLTPCRYKSPRWQGSKTYERREIEKID